MSDTRQPSGPVGRMPTAGRPGGTTREEIDMTTITTSAAAIDATTTRVLPVYRVVVADSTTGRIRVRCCSMYPRSRTNSSPSRAPEEFNCDRRRAKNTW